MKYPLEHYDSQKIDFFTESSQPPKNKDSLCQIDTKRLAGSKIQGNTPKTGLKQIRNFGTRFAFDGLSANTTAIGRLRDIANNIAGRRTIPTEIVGEHHGSR